MSLYNFATPRAVAERIKAGQVNKDWAVVDVRDSDYVGGHIPGCHHVPSATFNKHCMPLVNELIDVKLVIFHCVLSQQRGPSAAKLYANLREDNLTTGSIKSALPFGPEARARGLAQEVIIIQGGFKQWVETYKDDPLLVESYNPEFW